MRTFAQRIADMIRTAEAKGFNLYWNRSLYGSALRVTKARSRKQSGVIARYYTQVYCLPAGEWLEIPEVCLHQLEAR
jgi:hypothetical protein